MSMSAILDEVGLLVGLLCVHIMQTVVQTVIRAVSNGRDIINLFGINRSVVSDDNIRKKRRSQGVAERLSLLC